MRRKERGQTVTEYVLLLVLILLACFFVLTGTNERNGLRNSLHRIFNDINQSLGAPMIEPHF